MFKHTVRMPSGEVKESTAKNAGMGFFVTKDVSEGEAITLFARNVIPEWLAEIRKKKVLAYLNIYSVSMSFYQLVLLSFLNLQGNRHIRHNHDACCCLDSKPTAMRGYAYYSRLHQVAGFANSAIQCNAAFVNVGYDVVLVATKFIPKGTEVFVNYAI
jgi:hypothetical protein